MQVNRQTNIIQGEIDLNFLRFYISHLQHTFSLIYSSDYSYSSVLYTVYTNIILCKCFLGRFVIVSPIIDLTFQNTMFYHQVHFLSLMVKDMSHSYLLDFNYLIIYSCEHL